MGNEVAISATTATMARLRIEDRMLNQMSRTEPIDNARGMTSRDSHAGVWGYFIAAGASRTSQDFDSSPHYGEKG